MQYHQCFLKLITYVHIELSSQVVHNGLILEMDHPTSGRIAVPGLSNLYPKPTPEKVHYGCSAPHRKWRKFDGRSCIELYVLVMRTVVSWFSSNHENVNDSMEY